MTGPPAERPRRSDLAANQERGIPLLADRYPVLDAGGRKIFSVSREKAIDGIAAGVFAPIGRTCAKYVRLTSAADPSRSERHSAPRTWIGPPRPGEGAVGSYEHNATVCSSWGPDPRLGRGDR